MKFSLKTLRCHGGLRVGRVYYKAHLKIIWIDAMSSAIYLDRPMDPSTDGMTDKPEKHPAVYHQNTRNVKDIDGRPVRLEIVDTAGTEQFRAMRDIYMKDGNGFILVYDITNTASFEDVKVLPAQIARYSWNLHFRREFLSLIVWNTRAALTQQVSNEWHQRLMK